MKAVIKTRNPNRIKNPVKIRLLPKIFFRNGVFMHAFHLPNLIFLKSGGPKGLNRSTRVYVNKIFNTHLHHNTLVNNFFMHSTQKVLQRLFFLQPIESQGINPEITDNKSRAAGSVSEPALRHNDSLTLAKRCWDHHHKNFISHKQYDRISFVPVLQFANKEIRENILSNMASRALKTGSQTFFFAGQDKQSQEVEHTGQIWNVLKLKTALSIIEDLKGQNPPEAKTTKIQSLLRSAANSEPPSGDMDLLTQSQTVRSRRQTINHKRIFEGKDNDKIITGSSYLTYKGISSGEGEAIESGGLGYQNAILSKVMEYVSIQNIADSKKAFQPITVKKIQPQAVVRYDRRARMTDAVTYSDSGRNTLEMYPENVAMNKARKYADSPIYRKPLWSKASSNIDARAPFERQENFSGIQNASLTQGAIPEDMGSPASVMNFLKTSSRHDRFISKIIKHSNLINSRRENHILKHLKDLDYQKKIVEETQRGSNAFSYVQQPSGLAGSKPEGSAFQGRRMMNGRREEAMDFPQVIYKKEPPKTREMEAEQQKNDPVTARDEAHTVYERNDKKIKTQEVNIIADKVYKILEKRIMIERDRRGLN